MKLTLSLILLAGLAAAQAPTALPTPAEQQSLLKLFKDFQLANKKLQDAAGALNTKYKAPPGCTLSFASHERDDIFQWSCPAPAPPAQPTPAPAPPAPDKK